LLQRPRGLSGERLDLIHRSFSQCVWCFRSRLA
jgi:hypothetical protein